MPTLTIDGKPVTIEPLPATRRNETLLREVYADTTSWLAANAGDTFRARLARVCEKFSELLQFVTPDGEYNRGELARLADMYAEDYKDGDGNTMPREEALKMAVETLKTNYESWLRDNPVAARLLFFDAAAWPETAKGRDKGIELLRRTANLAALSDADLAERIASGDETAFIDTTPAEVARYVDRFREAYAE
jgi:hypothetical protein